MAKNVWFIGGPDGEMVEIEKLLISLGEEVVNLGLGWGAKALDYLPQILAVMERGDTPVLIELDGLLVVNHHMDDSGREASILQVCAILGKEPTRWMQLVAANDVSGFFGLRDFGATPEDIERTMRFDREAQGFTLEMEAISAQAVADAEYIVDIDLTIVYLPFSKFAAAKAILWLSGHKNIVCIAADGEIEFQGDGAVAKAVAKEFASSNPWSGGSGLGHAGRPDAYVGGYANTEKLVEFVQAQLGSTFR